MSKGNKDRLTKKEEDQLLDDLSMMTAVVVAQQQYLASIGKLEESKKYVQKFIADLQNKDLIKEIKKVN